MAERPSKRRKVREPSVRDMLESLADTEGCFYGRMDGCLYVWGVFNTDGRFGIVARSSYTPGDTADEIQEMYRQGFDDICFFAFGPRCEDEDDDALCLLVESTGADSMTCYPARISYDDVPKTVSVEMAVAEYAASLSSDHPQQPAVEVHLPTDLARIVCMYAQDDPCYGVEYATRLAAEDEAKLH